MRSVSKAEIVPDVQRRILDAAIELISLKGLSGITVRDITDAVGVNIASVNYYFGSKDALIKEVMLEVYRPVRATRSGALAAVLDRYAPEPAPVEAILTALIQPLVEAPRGKDGSRTIVRMMQHLRANPADPITHFVGQHFDYGAQGFIDALAQAMPELSRAEVIWRYEFARGAAIHMLAICDPLSSKLATLSGSKTSIDTSDDQAVLKEILQCTLIGVGAPPAWTRADREMSHSTRLVRSRSAPRKVLGRERLASS